MSLDGIRKRKQTNRHTHSSLSPNRFSEKKYSQPISAQKSGGNFMVEKNNLENLFTSSIKNTDRPPQKNNWKIFSKIFLYLFLILFLTILTVGLFFTWKISNISNKMTSTGTSETHASLLQTVSTFTPAKKRITLQGENSQRINILLLGIAGHGQAGSSLTDTIMIASIDTEKNKIALLSLPRDLYVKIPDTSYHTKINAVYKYGLNNKLGVLPLEKTIAEITGLKMNYFLIVNFSGFEKFIDNIGGINVEVKRDIYDPRYPGPNYSYELFEIKKGLHQMNGATALKYARERHNDPEGDFGRAKRQQQVLQSVKNKIFSTQILFNPFKLSALLDTLGDNIKTNITLPETKSFLKLLKQLDTQNINNAVIDAWKKDSLLKVSHIFYKDLRAFILVPRAGNYSEIQELAKNIFDLNVLKARQQKIADENAQITLLNASNDFMLPQKIRKFLSQNLNFKNITIIKNESLKQTPSTKIIDLTSGQKPFSLDELTKKIPATLSENSTEKNLLPEKIDKSENTDYDFIIILGKDLKASHNYQEDSLDDLNNQRHPINFDLVPTP